MQKKSDEMRATAPKININTAKWYERHFNTLNAGATWTLESLPIIYRQSLAEMRGKFTRGELCMMIDVLNGVAALMTYGSHGLAGQHLPFSVHDSFNLYPGQFEEKWDIQSGAMNAKIAGLTRFQIICLEIWAAGWRGGVDYQDAGAIDDHCKPLLGGELEAGNQP